MDNPLYRQIGERLRSARESLGISQEDIARQLGYSSPATISHFESGQRKISIVDLQQLTDVLGVSLDYLIGQTVPAQMQYFRMKAAHINPEQREKVATFLSFASTHSRESLEVPEDIRTSTPWHAADKVLDMTGMVEPPVSPRIVAKRFDISTFDWDFPDEISGLIAIENGAASIGVNDNHPNVRQRFTMAHELGHYVLHGQDIFVDFVDSEAVVMTTEKQEAQERGANIFAANLLMPKSWIERDFNESGADNLKYLAQRYGVSEQALWFRLLNLHLVNPDNSDTSQ